MATERRGRILELGKMPPQELLGLLRQLGYVPPRGNVAIRVPRVFLELLPERCRCPEGKRWCRA